MSTMQEKVDGLILGCNAMGWHSSAVFVKELAEQRAELLEALKQCKDALYEVDYSAPEIAMAREVIAKTEAAE